MSLVKTLTICICSLFLFACGNPPKKIIVSRASVPSSFNSLTIEGRVLAIENGKDGYIATIRTFDDIEYRALVSIVNLGSPSNFERFNVGDKVTLKEIPSELDGTKQFKVEEIIEQQPTVKEYCWIVNKDITLYTQPTTQSKPQGKHFQGEVLQVLDSRIIDDLLWVNVEFKLSVKTGYEHQFADGQVLSAGIPTGWIGGITVPVINCK
ncbi:MAG: hypothetical protein AAF960_05510 [Bacteroidota bacterium]